MLEEKLDERTEVSEANSATAVPRFAALIAALLVFIALLGYSVHERNLAQQLAQQNEQTASMLKETRGQMDALAAKLDTLANQQQHAAMPQSDRPTIHGRAVVHHAKPDPRWKKFQSQLDAQGKQIEDTRQDLASTRTDLQGSIAKTHDELVVLQRKGERNFYEFDVNKEKQFSHAGPVGISLRKANTKHQYADLELMVDDRQMSKKHLNLYEPAMFYPGDDQRPLEVVINSISKNHIHGYISAPKYRPSDLMAASRTSDPVTTADAGSQSGSPQLRRR